MVLDGSLIQAHPPVENGTLAHASLAALALARQPRAHLFALYQGWIDTLTAWQVARLTGRFEAEASPQRVELAARPCAIAKCLKPGLSPCVPRPNVKSSLHGALRSIPNCRPVVAILMHACRYCVLKADTNNHRDENIGYGFALFIR